MWIKYGIERVNIHNDAQNGRTNAQTIPAAKSFIYCNIKESKMQCLQANTTAKNLAES